MSRCLYRLGGFGIDGRQRDNGNDPPSAALVGRKDRVTAQLFGVAVVTFAAVQFGGVHVDDLVADLDLRVRVGEQVVVPAGAAVRSSLGCEDQIAAIIGHVHHRVDAACPGARSSGVQQEQWGADESAADTSTVGAEFGNNMGIEVIVVSHGFPEACCFTSEFLVYIAYPCCVACHVTVGDQRDTAGTV